MKSAGLGRLLNLKFMFRSSQNLPKINLTGAYVVGQLECARTTNLESELLPNLPRLYDGS